MTPEVIAEIDALLAEADGLDQARQAILNPEVMASPSRDGLPELAESPTRPGLFHLADPTPIRLPAPPPKDLGEQSVLIRVSESLRYGVATAEHRVSPEGNIRRFAYWTAKLTIIGGMVIGGVGLLASWALPVTVVLVAVAFNLLKITICVLVALLLIEAYCSRKRR